MSEELLQRGLLDKPEKIGKWDFYNIGATTLKSLKENKIIPNIDYKEFSKRKPDGLLVYKKNIIAVVENKKPSEFNTETKKKKAIKQGLEVSQKLNAQILIVTDTKETLWINSLTGKIISDEIGNPLKDVFIPSDERTAKLIDRILDSIDDKNSQITAPKIKDPSPLAKQIWQDIWSVSGATPENCLYTFVELFIFKYLSDLNVLPGLYSFDNLLKQYETNTEEQVLEYYANNIRKRIKELFPMNPKDRTTIINGTIFVSKDEKAVKGYSAVFKKILEKFESEGRLQNIHYDFKSKIFESFLKESISKKNWGQFFTPLKVVRAIVKMVEIKEGMTICDPACGVGKFLLEPILQDVKRFYKIENKKLKPQITLVGYDKGFDKDEQKTIILAKANMLIYLSDLIKEHSAITEQFAQLFNDTFLLKTNSILGTLSEDVTEEYDLILTNPPYVTSGSSNLKEEIVKSGLSNHYKVSALGVEGLFMEWIVRALKPGGKAFVVVPDGIMNRQNDSKLRKFISDECIIDGIISLPLNTFFTTNKKTYILCITKKTDNTKPQTTPVFTYLVSDIGETLDVYRFDTDSNHLETAAVLFNQFKNAKEHFKNDDERCKVQPFSKFKPEEHWSIDRWWSNDEKIKLGIEETKNTLTINTLSEFVAEIANELLEYQSPLKELAEKKKAVTSFKTISLSDKNIFDLFIGKRVVKKDLVKIKNGNIPLYSANVFVPIGRVTTSNIKSFSDDFIIWGIDGNFDFDVVRKGNIFATTDHCGSIRIKDKRISPFYLLCELNRIKIEYGYDRTLRASLKNMKSISIKIPINKDGEFDLEKQAEIASSYEVIDEMKKKVKAQKEKIENQNVELELNEKDLKKFKLKDLFDIDKGRSKYTKKFGNENKGDYPVYSASNNAPLTYINTFDFDGEYLTWATNGFAGYIKILTGKFSINGDRGILIPKKGKAKSINLKYIRFVLEPILRELAKGRKGEMGVDEFTKVYPSMIEDIEIKLPVTPKGSIDITKQNEVSKKIEVIDNIRKELASRLDGILDVNIDFLN